MQAWNFWYISFFLLNVPSGGIFLVYYIWIHIILTEYSKPCVYWGGKAKWTTLGFFFHEKNYQKKMSQKVTKLYSKKKYDFSFFKKNKLSKKKCHKKWPTSSVKESKKKKMRFSFYFSKKQIIEKKCHKKWPNSSVKKNTIFLFFFQKKKLSKKNV